ncbi:MAG: tetratricopeptide repeat protein [Deltaproteobacteria bacterium]|nr:tetratricopeptide repeat protein [Deltaproteobacteria bacterium]
MQRRTLVCVGLALFTLVVYGQVKGHEFLFFEDPARVAAGHGAQGLSAEGVKDAFVTGRPGFWGPLSRMSHMADISLFGRTAAAHHLVNALIHAAAAILLFLALAAMTGRMWLGALAAGLFAVHPINVEAVAWVAQRQVLLLGLFWMAGLLAYAWYAKKPSAGRYLAVCAALAAGLLSHPAMSAFPLVLLVLDAWPLGGETRRNTLGRLALEKVPMLLLAAGGVAAALALGGTPESLSPGWVRLAYLPVSALWILGHLVWPAGLAAYYPFPEQIPLWQPILSLALLALAVAGGVLQAAKRPGVLAGTLWFLISLVPMTLLEGRLSPAFAARWAYVPAAGVFILFSWTVGGAFAARKAVKSAAVAGGALLAVLAAASFSQAGYWKNDVTLLEHAIEVTGPNYLAEITLANALAARGEHEKARKHFDGAIAIRPDSPEAYNDRGASLLNQGNTAAAAEDFERAASLKPGFVPALYNLGLALFREQECERAIPVLEKVVEKDPAHAGAHGLLGMCLGRTGRLEEAIRHEELALAADPDRFTSLQNLGDIHFVRGELDKAREYYERALSVYDKVPSVHYELGRVLKRQEKWEEAIRHLEAAVALAPERKYSFAHFELGEILEKQGRTAEARECYAQALASDPGFEKAQQALKRLMDQRLADAVARMEKEVQKDPDNPVYLNRLGNLYKNQGELDKAMEMYQKALSLAPESAAVLNNVGHVHMTRGEYGRAEEAFARAMAAQPGLIPAYYNMACLHSLRGDQALAAEWLEKAAARGFAQWDLVEADEDLKALRDSPVYEDLRRRMENPAS